MFNIYGSNFRQKSHSSDKIISWNPNFISCTNLVLRPLKIPFGESGPTGHCSKLQGDHSVALLCFSSLNCQIYLTCNLFGMRFQRWTIRFLIRRLTICEMAMWPSSGQHYPSMEVWGSFFSTWKSKQDFI